VGVSSSHQLCSGAKLGQAYGRSAYLRSEPCRGVRITCQTTGLQFQMNAEISRALQVCLVPAPTNASVVLRPGLWNGARRVRRAMAGVDP